MALADKRIQIEFLKNEIGHYIARIEALEAALNECLPYIKQANVTAEAKHDNISGQYYMSGCEYEIMQETDLLMQKIAALNKGKD